MTMTMNKRPAKEDFVCATSARISQFLYIFSFNFTLSLCVKSVKRKQFDEQMGNGAFWQFFLLSNDATKKESKSEKKIRIFLGISCKRDFSVALLL